MAKIPVLRHGAEFTDEVALVREMLRSALWGIDYHEEGLAHAHERVAVGKALMERLGINISAEDALARYEEEASEDEQDFEGSEDFAIYIYGEVLHGVEWHEGELKQAHELLAAVKMVMQRGNYTEFTIDEVAADVKKEAEE